MTLNDASPAMLRAIRQTGTDGRTIKIVSRIERPASLSDNEAASYWRSAAV
ncbi:hypothetical protein [Bradyrhizobium sp. URHC0002]